MLPRITVIIIFALTNSVKIGNFTDLCCFRKQFNVQSFYNEWKRSKVYFTFIFIFIILKITLFQEEINWPCDKLNIGMLKIDLCLK